MFGNLGLEVGKAFFARDDRLARAHGTSVPPRRARGDGRLPRVPLRTAPPDADLRARGDVARRERAVFTRPPDFFLAAVGNGVRRERKIARFVPFFQ